MRKLFFTFLLAFGFMSFTSVSEAETKLETAVFDECIELTLSCGISGILCGDTSNEMIIALDDLLCGPFAY